MPLEQFIHDGSVAWIDAAISERELEMARDGVIFGGRCENARCVAGLLEDAIDADVYARQLLADIEAGIAVGFSVNAVTIFVLITAHAVQALAKDHDRMAGLDAPRGRPRHVH